MMPTATVRRKPSKVEPLDSDRRSLHRVGSLVNDKALRDPQTLGERMAARRLELKMTQQQVAQQVTFEPKTGRNEGKKFALSRNAYCMYETGDSEPDITKIIAIAQALDVTPQWLAFGVGDREKVDAFVFHEGKKKFVAAETWVVPEDWLADNFHATPQDIEFYLIFDYQDEFSPGDIAIVKRKAEPTPAGGQFLYVINGRVAISQIIRPRGSAKIRLFNQDSKRNYKEVAINSIQIVGRVIGKIGSMERRT